MVSTHWPLFRPKDGEKLSDEELDVVATAFEVYLRPALPDPRSHRLYFDHGTETLDAHYAAYQARIDRVVARARISPRRDLDQPQFPRAGA